jgi:hypothetical protein
VNEEQMRELIQTHEKLLMGAINGNGIWVPGLLHNMADMSGKITWTNRLLVATVTLLFGTFFRTDVLPFIQWVFK